MKLSELNSFFIFFDRGKASKLCPSAGLRLGVVPLDAILISSPIRQQISRAMENRC